MRFEIPTPRMTFDVVLEDGARIRMRRKILGAIEMSEGADEGVGREHRERGHVVGPGGAQDEGHAAPSVRLMHRLNSSLT